MQTYIHCFLHGLRKLILRLQTPRPTLHTFAEIITYRHTCILHASTHERATNGADGLVVMRHWAVPTIASNNVISLWTQSRVTGLGTLITVTVRSLDLDCDCCRSLVTPSCPSQAKHWWEGETPKTNDGLRLWVRNFPKYHVAVRY